MIVSKTLLCASFKRRNIFKARVMGTYFVKTGMQSLYILYFSIRLVLNFSTIDIWCARDIGNINMLQISKEKTQEIYTLIQTTIDGCTNVLSIFSTVHRFRYCRVFTFKRAHTHKLADLVRDCNSRWIHYNLCEKNFFHRFNCTSIILMLFPFHSQKNIRAALICFSMSYMPAERPTH